MHFLGMARVDNLDDEDDGEFDEEALISAREISLEEAEERDEDGEDDVVRYEPQHPEEGIYGMAFASVILDTRKLVLPSSTSEQKVRHAFRLILSILILFFTIGLQLWITLETKFIVTPDAVSDIREAYSEYENHMYSGHTELTVHGNHRGIVGFYNVSKFQELTNDEQGTICNFPLSEPKFLGAILLLWTLTCFRYLRKIASFTFRVIGIPCNISTMGDPRVFEPRASRQDASSTTETPRGESHHETVHVLANITWQTKLLVLVFIQAPAFFMNSLLLWIGCRYLVATVGFGEILLNAIALEFVLFSHELLYAAIVPHSMKAALGRIVVKHPKQREAPNFGNMFGAFCMLVVAVVWTYLYVIKFQQVLPDYGWDISAACEKHHTTNIW